MPSCTVFSRPFRRQAPLLAAVVIVALAGCQDDRQSPTAPGPEPALTAATAALAAPSFISISAGLDHSCGITTGTRAYCWGNNLRAQLGTSDRIMRLAPAPVYGDRPFDAVEAGYWNSCGVTTADKAYCWGQNLPTGTTSRPSLVDPTLLFTQVSVGRNHFCGVRADGKAYCRGQNSYGQLGDGSQTDRSTPVAVAGGHSFRQISTYTYHTCAVTTDGRAFCWGTMILGDGNTVTLGLQPVAVAGGLRFREISTGSAFTCGVTTDDRAFCWGDNGDGQLGEETLDAHLTPTLVHGGKRFLQLDAGENHVCGATTDHRAFCWGRSAEGQLGTGKFDTITHGMKPQLVAGGLSWRQISAGGLHSCGVTTTDVAYCWGYNYQGRLGDGTQVHRGSPTKVVGGS
jgi:alpha-tubulin suppressor-like RCC1 family protein